MKFIAFFALFGTASLAHAQDAALEERAVALAKSQNKDTEKVGEFLRGRGGKNDFQVLLEAGKCYWFSAASVNLGKVAMFLWTPNANVFTPRVADTKSSSGEATLAYCTKEPGLYKFQVKANGSGNFVVGVFAKEAPKELVKPQVDLGAICDKTAAAAAPEAVRVGEHFSGFGSSIGHDDRIDYTVQMDAGKCYWIVGCGDPETVSSLYLFLWGPDNKRITEAKSDTRDPMLGHCANAAGMFKVQAKMNSGKGAFKVGVYRK